jgi:hypothetical protein
MEPFNKFTKNFWALLLLTSTTACINSSTSKEKKSGAITNPAEMLQTTKVARVKNYNQYNMTLEKLTGISRSQFHGTFEEIKGSLPADNEISGMTPFNLISMTRLADGYCSAYVNTKIPADYFVSNPEERLTDLMMSTFLDEAPANRPDYYQALLTEINNVYNNDDGSGNRLFPSPSANSVQAYKDYSVAACVLILTSPYITLLE